MITTEQVKAARMFLRWSQAELAEKSGVPLSTLKRIDGRPGLIKAHSTTVWKIQTTMELAGVEFISADELGGYGVRIK